MSVKREPFPSTSLGRSFQPPPPPPATEAGSTPYVTYKARPRPVLPTIDPPELVELRSVARSLDIAEEHIGWSILYNVVFNTSAEWIEIYNMLTATTSRWSLLLPAQLQNKEQEVDIEFVKDHVLAIVGDQFLTLSGLRGLVIESQTLVVRSSISPVSQAFRSFLATSSALPPLPLLDHHANSFPTLKLGQVTSTNIHVPARVSATGFPFNSSNDTATPRIPVSPSRLPNPFANLFGGTRDGRTPVGSTPGTPNLSAANTPQKPKEELPLSIHVFTTDKAVMLQDIAKEVNTALRDAMRKAFIAAIRQDDPDYFPPIWVLEEFFKFIGRLVPFVKKPKAPRPLTGNPLQDQSARQKELLEQAYVINPLEDHPEDLTGVVQQFYADVADRLCTPLEEPEQDPYEYNADEPNADFEEKVEQQQIHDSRVIHRVLTALESTICDLFYDRLFIPSLSDDSSHDEALSSRVAALNMLDLGLEHLDIVVGSQNEEPEPEPPAVMSGAQKKMYQRTLDRRKERIKAEKEKKTVAIGEILRECGNHLSSLQDGASRTPASKVRILVEAHKMIVDGLGQIPGLMLRLKTEKEIEAAIKEREKEKLHINLVQEEDLDGIEKAQKTAGLERQKSLDLELDEEAPVTGVLFSAGSSNHSNMMSPPHNFSVFSPMVFPVPEEPTPDAEVLPVAVSIPLPESPPPSPPPTPPPKQEEEEQPVAPISGDVLFPLIVFSVVKSNPPSLVSHLLFAQRFRIPNYAEGSAGGEESYCLTNLLAVAEFLENVDMEALGLSGAAERVSTINLTPIPIPAISPHSVALNANQLVRPGAGLLNLQHHGASAFDSLSIGAGKVLGVVDSSFGMLKGWLPGGPAAVPVLIPAQKSAPWNNPNYTPEKVADASASIEQPAQSATEAAIAAIVSPKSPGFGLLRRTSVLGMVPSLSLGSAPVAEPVKEEELRPVPRLETHEPEEAESSELESDDDDSEEEIVSGSGDDSEDPDDVSDDHGADGRSIRSFGSMLNSKRKGKSKPRPLSLKSPLSGRESPRKSLTDRLARVGSSLALKAKNKSPPSTNPLGPGLPAANPRFTTFCKSDASDLTLSEVKQLLKEYRTLVDGVQRLDLVIGERDKES